MTGVCMRLRATFVAGIQISLLLFFGIILISNRVSATDPSVTDEINLTVPVSCSLSGTGMDTHTTELHNTESDSAIGESTITAYCNDLNGLSIYAVGFTNNEYGNNNLVSVTASTTNTIPTGTNTSGDTSSWAMKLTPITNPTPTYPITIIGSTDDTDKTPTTLDYTSFQSVPNEYALVARRKASTDVGTNAEGSSFKTTYQAYAASGQAAGTYEGQVRYTLVHPYNHAVPDPPSFKVLYTGRPLSTEPGHENPVTVLMSDLPQDGKYNLLGSTAGSYDKLTPGTLYAGYYTYTGTIDEFDDFLESYEVYDGSNIDWSVQQSQTTDAAEIEPENETFYMVKEVPDGYLQNYYHITFVSSTNELTGFILMSAIDDLQYEDIGFDISNNSEMAYYVETLTIRGNPTVSVITPSSAFGNKGVENGYIIYSRPSSMVAIGDHTVRPYWVTLDRYKVTGSTLRTVTVSELTNAGVSHADNNIGSSITKW